jgi:hypothetical protein
MSDFSHRLKGATVAFLVIGLSQYWRASGIVSHPRNNVYTNSRWIEIFSFTKKAHAGTPDEMEILLRRSASYFWNG